MALPVLTRVALTWPVPTRAWSADVTPTAAEPMIARATSAGPTTNGVTTNGVTTNGATTNGATTAGATTAGATTVGAPRVTPTDISATSNVSPRAARVGPHPGSHAPQDPVTTGVPAGELGQEGPEMLLDDWQIR